MIYFLTYGNDKYKQSKERIEKEAYDINIFDKVIIKSPNDLPDNLPEMTKKVLTLERGGGYWIWKPIIVKQQLDIMNDDDILIYVDAGCHINKNGTNRLYEYISYLDKNKPILRFIMNFVSERTYTTSSIFKYFNKLDDNNITSTGQYIATSFIILKNEHINYYYIILK